MSKKNPLPTEEQLAKHRSMKLVDKYVGLDPDENVLLLAHRHWVEFRNPTLLTFFVPFVLLFCIFFVNVYPVPLSADIIEYINTALLSLAGLILVAGLMGLLWRYHLWRRTFYVMTNKRLAVINRFKPWSYEVQQLNLGHIDDVTLKQEGFEAHMYGYADVQAITFSGSTFTFHRVGHAPAVQKMIMQQLAQQKHPPFGASEGKMSGE